MRKEKSGNYYAIIYFNFSENILSFPSRILFMFGFILESTILRSHAAFGLFLHYNFVRLDKASCPEAKSEFSL
jgi:hypothetical protein